MKKTLIAVAALAATGAFAQVSVYGRLDAGYAMTTNTLINGTGAGANYDVKDNGVRSHNSVSSMWGIRGSEDLGGGLKANFQLEQDIYTANGMLGNTGTAAGAPPASVQFNRVSLLGLSGAFGTVSFGRDYVPTFKLIGATEINGFSRVSTVNLSNNTGVSTTDNVVFYSSPVMSGFQVNLAYRNADTTNTSATGDSTSKLTNITATYTNGPLFVGIGTGSTEARNAGANNTQINLAGWLLPTITAEKISGNVLAASYNFGSFRLVGNYITTKIDNANLVAAAATTPALAAGNYEIIETNIGATVPLGKVTLKAQVGQNTLKKPVGSDSTGTDVVVGADYALSSKTSLFLTTGTMAKLNNLGPGEAYELKQTSTAIGIKTVF